MQDLYESHIRQMTADDYWQRLVKSGWLADVPESTHAQLEQDVRAAFARDPLLAWSVLAVTAFDSECIYDTEPQGLSYHAKIAFLAQTTLGVFKPTHIYNQYVGHDIWVSFRHHGKTFGYNASADTDYFDTGVIDLINQALKDSGTTKQLINLPVTDQVFYFVVVSEQTYRRAEQMGLIPPPAYFIYKQRYTTSDLNAYVKRYFGRR